METVFFALSLWGGYVLVTVILTFIKVQYCPYYSPES